MTGIPRVSVSTGSGAPTTVEEGGSGPSDDLTRIDGVDTSMERRLREQGIRRLHDLAALTAADVKGVGESLHLGGRIERENWVGQAKILAAGGQTYYSRRVDDGIPVPEGVDPAAAVADMEAPAPAPAPEPAPQPASQSAAPEPVMEGIPFVSVSRGSGAPVKVEEGGAGPSESLTRIHGIDEGLQGRLKELGIRRVRDIAGLTAQDVKGLGETLGIAGRPDEERWVAQAQILAEGGETYYSRRIDHGMPMPSGADPAARVMAEPTAAPAAAPAPKAVEPAPAPPTVVAAEPMPEPAPAAAAPGDSGTAGSNVSHLRSVRSEAFLGEEAARTLRPAGDGDDLKRIRGIGVLIEKKLNSLGITHYEQIANWTGADIERISRLLDFKGRIERENWIEQARILATGGQTEFSRRGG
jgi:predicted flap endonuclease-1-like 5' DNA nuclease